MCPPCSQPNLSPPLTPLCLPVPVVTPWPQWRCGWPGPAVRQWDKWSVTWPGDTCLGYVTQFGRFCSAGKLLQDWSLSKLEKCCWPRWAKAQVNQVWSWFNCQDKNSWLWWIKTPNLSDWNPTDSGKIKIIVWSNLTMCIIIVHLTGCLKSWCSVEFSIFAW